MKTILITGSNKGIGFEIARQCAIDGHSVIISGRNKLRVNEAQEILAKEGWLVETLTMDVSDPQSVLSAASEFASRNISLDVLINNAAIIVHEDDSLLNDPEDSMKKTMNTNCFGPLRVTKAFVEFMKKGSHIINISSGGGSMTDPIGGWAPAYCVSKSALNALTRHLAYELQSQHIRVNAVCPGWVKTEMGGAGAEREVEKGAETPAWLVNDGAGERTGLFFRDKQQIPW